MNTGRSIQWLAAFTAGIALTAPSTAQPNQSPAQPNVSTERRQVITETGIPAPYFRLRNPLPFSRATLLRGERIYARNCSGCHGTIVNPVGKASGELVPQPTDLKALRQLSPKTLDAYMYWTIAEGGVPYATAMPSYKSVLPRRDIWSVIAFVRSVVGSRPPAASPVHK